jgi:outer membrane protein TolC
VDWPVDQLAERNVYRRSLIGVSQAQRAYVTNREQVVATVRNVARAIRVAQVSVEIQRRSVDLNERRLALANERYLQGKAAVLDVTDAQSALLNAQDALDSARANLQTQVLNYLRDTGTLRLDPQAGAIARAMDRAALQSLAPRELDKVEQEMRKLERQ